MQELGYTDAPSFETEQHDDNAALDDLVMSTANREATEHHSDSDVDMYSESDFTLTVSHTFAIRVRLYG